MQDRSFQQRIGRIETLVAELEAVSDPVVKAAAKELVASVMDLNAAAFERVLQVAARYGEPGSRLMDGLVRDEAVSSLLILYGLHPQDFETRVRGALKNFEGVSILSIEDGRIVLRMDSQERSESAVRLAVSTAAPDLADLIIEGSGQTGFVPLAALAAAPARANP
ncbi:MAG TPA: hypothetical protein VK708_14625 [Bryobacteraceae bacterium]|jgi:hypothetical protein|nr:hypothetical protein [Bryobacteraceae bacterium]